MKLNLVPWPVKVQMRPGSFNLRGVKAPFVLADDHKKEAVRQKLKELGFRYDPRNWQTAPASKLVGFNHVVIGSPKIKIALKPPAKPEGYTLYVDRGGIAVAGHDGDGLYWGLVTLGQLANGGPKVPCVQIEDYPAFPLRYHHDDISRKCVSKVGDFKRIIRLLSSYKVRYYTPYMEDMLFLKSHPDIGVGRGRLMPEEVREILAEGKRYNVTVFPTYSLIGHQENLLQNPRYRKFAQEVFQEPSSYDVTKPELREYLRQVIQDVCELFPDAPYFHACFDECIGVAEGPVIAYANWCAREIARHGKRMMMWVDMFKNHWGLEKLRELDPNIIPVEWGYGSDLAEVERKYQAAKIVPTGLAGYNSWCCYLPDYRAGKRNMDQWVGLMRRWGGTGFGASQWGDVGYENSRDLSWNMFSYNAEAGWRGDKPKSDFEERFEATFYGRVLPPLLKLIQKTAPTRKLAPRQYWALFRSTLPAMVRLAVTDKKLIQGAKHDRALLTQALADVAAAQRLAEREKGHLDHFAAAIERERNVCDRLLLADQIARGLSGAKLRTAVAGALRELARVKKVYRSVWLRQFKKENLEVSLAVYEAVAKSLREFLTPPPPGEAGWGSPRYEPINLTAVFNTCKVEVAGVPIGTATVEGVPFEFAGLRHTHVNVTQDRPVVLKLPTGRVRDLHLICAGQTLDRDLNNLKPVVEVELRRQGKAVFKEQLLAIRHVCDWFAPRGEHMWAGGGMKYVDQKRVSLALDVGTFHALTHLKGFACRGAEADEMVIRSISKAGFYLFAVTVEKDGS